DCSESDLLLSRSLSLQSREPKDHLGYPGIQQTVIFSRFLRLLSQGLNQNVDHAVFCESLSLLRQQFALGLGKRQQQPDLHRTPYQPKGKHPLCPRCHGNAASLRFGCMQRNLQRSYVACVPPLNVQLLHSRFRQLLGLNHIESRYMFYQRSLLLHRESSDHREQGSYPKLYRQGYEALTKPLSLLVNQHVAER